MREIIFLFWNKKISWCIFIWKGSGFYCRPALSGSPCSFLRSVRDLPKAGDPEQTGFCWYVSGYCQKMKNLLIKLGVFASDDRPKILVLSLDRKPEIPLPKRLCQWVCWQWDVVSPGGVYSKESPEHMTAQAQGLSLHTLGCGPRVLCSSWKPEQHHMALQDSNPFFCCDAEQPSGLLHVPYYGNGRWHSTCLDSVWISFLPARNLVIGERKGLSCVHFFLGASHRTLIAVIWSQVYKLLGSFNSRW